MRYRIERNIGHALVRLGKYNDAMNMYADVMQHAPDTHTGFNLVVCHYSLGGRDTMKKAFQKLVQARAGCRPACVGETAGWRGGWFLLLRGVRAVCSVLHGG